MPERLHHERHFTASATVRDIIIGMSDGLTVPFALAAGLTGAVHATNIIVIAGLAEIAAGSISMGLGGYLAGKSDIEVYQSERRREVEEVREVPEREREEVRQVLRCYGLAEKQFEPVVEALVARPDAWVDFMMRFELGLEEPEPRRALVSALTIAGAYILGGFIPLTPYMVANSTQVGFAISACVTLIALALFGSVKGRFTGVSPWRSAGQTLVIGGLAASAAFFIARAISR